MIPQLGLLSLSGVDLFEHYELLPLEVREVLTKHENEDGTYENCEELIKDLNKVGYTCDYGLDGVPFDLKENGMTILDGVHRDISTIVNYKVIQDSVSRIVEKTKTQKLSIQEFHELRNKEYQKLVENSVIINTDKNFQKFDELLGGELNVNWD